jgi:hypothetical protein
VTLPTSGALSLDNIKTEFGGPASPSLGDYYAGGTYVPAGTSGTNGAVPSSGTISIGSFYGTGLPVISITTQNLTNVTFSPTNSTQLYRLDANGKVYDVKNGSASFIEDWVTPNGAASNYEALVTVTSGTLSSGTSGSWVALSSTRDWSVTQSSVGTKTCVFTVDIRKVGTGTVLDSATITLDAEVA